MFSTPQAITAVGRFHLYNHIDECTRTHSHTRTFVYLFIRLHDRVFVLLNIDLHINAII